MIIFQLTDQQLDFQQAGGTKLNHDWLSVIYVDYCNCIAISKRSIDKRMDVIALSDLPKVLLYFFNK